jgi:hypothetical protein
LPAAFQPDANFAQGRPEPFGYWRDVTGASCRDRVAFDVDYGAAVLRVTIACPGEFRIWHGDTPDSPPRRRESFYVETTGTQAVFTTTLEPAR